MLQLALPLDFAPDVVRDHGLRDAHPRPLVGRRKRRGGFQSWRTSPSKAWAHDYLQLENAGSNFATITMDCDRPRELGLAMGDLPPANWIVRNTRNRHAHVTWCLAVPVHKYPDARIAPLSNLRRIAEYYRAVTAADPGYAHTLTRNPMLSNGTQTEWGAEEPYLLDALANVIPFNWKAPSVSTTGVGRHCDLFKDLMAWAGRPANAHIAVLTAATIRNQDFDVPLLTSDLKATSKVIERYRTLWATHGWHCPKWLAKQAARGRLSGISRRKGSNEETKPWKADGVSRRTWYRHRAQGRGTRTNIDRGGCPSLCSPSL